MGRSLNDPLLSQLKHLIMYNLVPLEDRGVYGVSFDNNTLPAEAVAGIILSYAKDIASKTAKTSIKDCVITVILHLT